MLELAEEVRDSYWFVPGLIASGGLLAGLGLVFVDGYLGSDWLGRFQWFTGSRPEGARSVLSTVAGSTITVAGVVFSITLAAVTYASGQYGPRLLSNFQRDRGNQATLGVFLATYLYCLVVLRTIRSAAEASADTGGTVREAFVPHLAVYCALALALASIAVLIYFVHHVTDGIHINNVIARIGQDLIDDVRRSPIPAHAPTPDDWAARDPAPVAAAGSGYLEAIDQDALRALAAERGVALRLLRRPGDFVHAGRPLLEAAPAALVGPELAEACNEAVAVGRRRSALQDLRFSIDELVEVAARALSPGVNDPFTAIACLDWLGAALTELDRRAATGANAGGGGEPPRLFADPLFFEDYLASAFGQLRPYVAADVNARRHALRTLDEVACGAQDAANRAALLAERERLSAAPEA